MVSEYLCWRITGELVNSIDGCPLGSIDECMYLSEGDICPCEKEITI